MISKNVKKYTKEEDLRDREESNYEEFYTLAVKCCNGYDNELEANVPNVLYDQIEDWLSME